VKDQVEQRYREELQKHFGADERRIHHAGEVLAYAKKIMEGEGVDSATRKIVTITALLHDVGIKAAELKYHSSAGRYQEIEGPAIVRAILTSHNEPEELIQRVAYIVGGHHTAKKNDGLDFQIIWEADLLVNMEEEGLGNKPDQLAQVIAKNFRTPTGLQIVSDRFRDKASQPPLVV
jgi:HD superfamily phosphodiesterase